MNERAICISENNAYEAVRELCGSCIVSLAVADAYPEFYVEVEYGNSYLHKDTRVLVTLYPREQDGIGYLPGQLFELVNGSDIPQAYDEGESGDSFVGRELTLRAA